MTKVPYELSSAYVKAIDGRNHAAFMIKSYTDDWIKHQKKIIELDGVLKVLTKSPESKALRPQSKEVKG